MNTIEEMQAALDDMVSAMLDKGIPQPQSNFEFCSGAEPNLCLWSVEKTLDGEKLKMFKGDPEVIVRNAQVFISTLPNAVDIVQTEYLRRVADAVDYATQNALPEEYVAPLRGVSCAMTENLLMKGGEW